MKITLKNGGELDMSKALPLLVGDWRKLAKAGAGIKRLQSLPDDTDERIEVAAIVADYFLAKIGSEFTSDVLSLDDLPKFLDLLADGGRETVDRPT